MSRRRDLIELGRSAADMALNFGGCGQRTMPFSADERRLVLASLIQAVLATGAVTIKDAHDLVMEMDRQVARGHGDPS